MYFCYLLKSQNEKHKNDTYIGFTDNPLKRLKQHNGIIKGGAKKTSKKRPWNLVLVISNFPNKILALKFEWAWTNPFISNFTAEKLKNFDVPSSVGRNKKKYYESIEFKLKALNVLINSKVYDKISLYLHVFDNEIIINKLIETNHQQIMELVDDKNFKESVKNKIYFYNENINEEDGMLLGNYNNNKENIIDKCLICSENLIENNVDKTNSKNNMISSGEDSDSNLNFNNNLGLGNNNINNEEEIDQNDQNSTSENLAKCPYCKTQFHLTCLAISTLENQNSLLYALIPNDTLCMICGRNYNWSEFIKD